MSQISNLCTKRYRKASRVKIDKDPHQKFPYKNKSEKFNFLSILAESVFTLEQAENSFKGVSYLTIHTFPINEVQSTLGLCFGLKNPQNKKATASLSEHYWVKHCPGLLLVKFCLTTSN